MEVYLSPLKLFESRAVTVASSQTRAASLLRKLQKSKLCSAKEGAMGGAMIGVAT